VSLHYGCNGVDHHPSCTPSVLIPLPPAFRALAFSFRPSPTLFPSPYAPYARWLVGLAAPGLHPRSHLFIIKFHVYRQPVRWRSEFLSECVYTRPRGGERERGHDTHAREQASGTHACRRTRIRARVHVHVRG